MTCMPSDGQAQMTAPVTFSMNTLSRNHSIETGRGTVSSQTKQNGLGSVAAENQALTHKPCTGKQAMKSVVRILGADTDVCTYPPSKIVLVESPISRIGTDGSCRLLVQHKACGVMR